MLTDLPDLLGAPAFVTPTPSGEPLALDEAKRNLKDPEGEDDLILDLIIAAREYVECVTGLVLTRRVVTDTARHLGRWIDLSFWPIASIEEIRYPVGGSMVALPRTAWMTSLLRRPVRILPRAPGWGVANGFDTAGLPIEIDVVAGYASPDEVPRQAKQAMRLLVAHWWGNRSAVEAGVRAAAVAMPLGVKDLLNALLLRQV